MLTSDHLYSRVISGLKIALPLVAIGSMSSMFLMSKSAPDQSKIPFAQVGLIDKIRDQQLSQPYFSGTTDAGDRITLSASAIKPDLKNPGSLMAENILTSLSDQTGQTITFAGQRGVYHDKAKQIDMTSGVQILTEDGYQLSAATLSMSFEHSSLIADGPIQGTGPHGILEAGRLEVTRENPQAGFLIVFKNGVKVVYDPQN